MTSSTGLQEYLAQFGRRLKLSLASRGAGAVAIAALVLTVVLVYVANQFAFSGGSVIGARLVLLLSLAAAIVLLLVLPFKRLRKKGVSSEIEKNVPAFGGRVATYWDHTERSKRTGQKPSPLLDLLAEDALKVARTAPAETLVTTGRIASYGLLAAAAVGVLLWLGAAGPGYWGYGTMRLWTGWINPDTKPLYELAVEPGDARIRSGANLKVRADLIGFDSSDVFIAAEYAGAVDWETAPMIPQPEGSGYEFTFTGVREPFRYYVRAGGMRSHAFEVDVVEMPNIEGVKLRYQYPSWTGLEPHAEDPGGDVRAVEGTKVHVEVETDKPLRGGLLIVNGKDVPLKTDGLSAKAEFVIAEDGEYHVAALYEGERVRLTDDYFITAVPNRKPEVRILRPGRDWRATNIEEVTVQVEATDDFGVRGLELHYAVNGGEWQKLALKASGQTAQASHTFFLEDMAALAPAPKQRSRGGIDILPFPIGRDREKPKEETTVAARPAFLRPGDLITYYAVARDNKHEARTDIYFIEVQPFDRSFTQSQQGGGMPGGGENEQNEISRRQKEIIAATWNLIQEQNNPGGRSREEVRESASMLSELQRTLRGQAETLAQRTRARQLADTNEKFRQFVENLELAVEEMGPAADELARFKLQDAVQPEQRALQYLLRAESLFTDIQVAFQQGGGGGGGGASSDLAEMFELEMDLEKNQYETGGGGASQQQLEREIDDAFRKLEELARRQEQLAEQMRRDQQASFSQRWQQEMLRREAEELKRQMEQLQRRQESQQSASPQQSSQGSQGSQGSQPSQPSQQQSRQLEQTIQRLEQASQSMEQSGQSGSGSPQQQSAQAQASAQRAKEQLRQAADQLAQQRREASQAAISGLSNRANDLVRRQAEVQPQIEEAMRKAVEQMRKDQAEGRRTRVPSGLTRDQERELSEAKRGMAEDLQGIEREMQEQARRLREAQPEVSRRLRNSLGEMQESELTTRLSTAADYIRRGGAPYVASGEEGVARGLRDLADSLKGIEQAAQQGGGRQGERGEGLARALADMENLRRQLERAAGASGEPGQGQGAGQEEGRQPGQGEGQQEGAGGQQPGQQPGQGQGQQQQQAQDGGQGQGQQPGQQGGQGQQPGQGEGQGQQGAGEAQSAQSGRQPGEGGGGPSFLRGGPQRGGTNAANFGGSSSLRRRLAEDAEFRAGMERALQESMRQVPQLAGELRRGGIQDQDLDALRKFVRDLPNSHFQGNPELLEQEYRKIVALLEQLELQVRRQAELGAEGDVRSPASEPVPQEYREAVAEYFRRLSKQQ